MSAPSGALTSRDAPLLHGRGTGPVALPPEMLARMAEVVEHAQASGTSRAYRSAWARFEEWCADSGYVALPAAPEVIAAYLVTARDTVTEAGERAYAPSTLGKWVSAIADRHRRAGMTDLPTQHELVRATLAGIRREYATAGERRPVPRAPLLTDDIMALVATAREQVYGWADAVIERRDTALMLMGYTAALRRSELAALRGGDVTVHELDGLHISVRRSKRDQEGHGSLRAVPRAEDPARCTACAAARWAEVVAAGDRHGRRGIIRLLQAPGALAAPGVAFGHVCTADETGPGEAEADSRTWVVGGRPFFRAIARNGLLSSTPLSGASVHAVIRRRAAQAGFGPEILERLGGHSLRAGFVTQAMRNGADAAAVMRQTDHHSEVQVHAYRREHTPLIGNAVHELGL